MFHALALSVPIPAPHLPAALDVGPFVPGVAYTAPKDYYGMPVDAGYAGLINRAQQLIRPAVLLQYLHAFIKEYAELFPIAS